MADVIEVASGPSAVDQSGNLTIWWVPTIADVTKPKVTEIGAGTRITYSFVPGGWALTMPQEKLDDDRLTSPWRKQALGKISPELADLNYVDSTASGSAAVVLAPTAPATSKAGFFVERRNVAQTELVKAADMVRVVDASVGAQAPGPTDGTGKFAVTQPVAINSVTGPVAVTAT